MLYDWSTTTVCMVLGICYWIYDVHRSFTPVLQCLSQRSLEASLPGLWSLPNDVANHSPALILFSLSVSLVFSFVDGFLGQLWTCRLLKSKTGATRDDYLLFAITLLGLDDGPGREDLRDLRDGTRDWGKGRVYILYAITDAITIQAVVVYRTIHQSVSTPAPWPERDSAPQHV
jgi:hypothetical protein